MKAFSNLIRLNIQQQLSYRARGFSRTTQIGLFRSANNGETRTIASQILGSNSRNPQICGISWSIWTQRRWKSRKTSGKSDDDAEFVKEINSDETDTAPGDHKDITTHVSSLRLDNVLKSAFGIPKSDIEAAFYTSNIRLNGRKVLKKSTDVDIGDEIDIIKGASPTSHKFLEVMRAVILSIKIPNSEATKVQVKMRRFKQLIIENYDDSPFQKEK